MDEAFEAGINFFDTADVYGGPQSPDMEKGFGKSEEIIGNWLSQGGRRDRIVLATKVYQPMETGPNDRGLCFSRFLRSGPPRADRYAVQFLPPFIDDTNRTAHILGVLCELVRNPGSVSVRAFQIGEMSPIVVHVHAARTCDVKEIAFHPKSPPANGHREPYSRINYVDAR
jgi:diketogulonate reductase-like aldo/keto reductase